MKKLLTILAAMMFLPGCSELRVIGDAAMKELQSEAISVEMAAYRVKRPLPSPAPKPAEKVYVAKAEFNPFAAGQPRMAAKSAVKGLWEGN